jgi:hypothetical protein
MNKKSGTRKLGMFILIGLVAFTSTIFILWENRKISLALRLL